MLFRKRFFKLGLFLFIFTFEETRAKGKEKREKRREFYALAIRIHTRESKFSPFIREIRERVGRQAAAKRKGCM